MSSIILPIKQVSGPKKSSLILEGTILIYNERRWASKGNLQIPVELISVSENSRFDGGRLIMALLCLVMPLLLVAIFAGIMYSPGLDRENTSSQFLPLFYGLPLIIGFISFCIMFIRFFFKQKTVMLTIAPTGTVIEFWQEPKLSGMIGEFLKQLKERQNEVVERIPFPAKQAVGASNEHPIRKLCILVFLFCLPALMTEIPQLLFLGLLPIARYFYTLLQRRAQPREYRQALASYERKRWEEAETTLRLLLKRIPDHASSLVLLTDICILNNRFDEALKFISRLSSEYEETTRNMQETIWRFKRIYERRKLTI